MNARHNYGITAQSHCSAEFFEGDGRQSINSRQEDYVGIEQKNKIYPTLLYIYVLYYMFIYIYYFILNITYPFI